jgi:hypothetical protein
MDTMVAQKTSPKALSRLNFQVEDSEKFGLRLGSGIGGQLRDVGDALGLVAGEQLGLPTALSRVSTYFGRCLCLVAFAYLPAVLVE